MIKFLITVFLFCLVIYSIIKLIFFIQEQREKKLFVEKILKTRKELREILLKKRKIQKENEG